MPRTHIPKALMLAGALMTAAAPVFSAAAMAQENPPPYNGQTEQNYPAQPPQGYQGYQAPQGYNNQAPQGYQSQAPQGYQAPPTYNGQQQAYAPPAEPGPPPGYAPGQMPPPPQGYAPSGPNSAQQEADARYAQSAQYWMQQNCVKSHGDAVAGAVVGGIFGAIVGGAIGGRHSGGALVGGVVGAGTGAAIADSAGDATSPGCPQGYVLRQGAAPYSGPSGYYYAAPSWYVPWVLIGGAWVFRPYPYHDWYWHTYRGPHGYYRGGNFHGGEGHRGHRGW